jgi:hypothetical protein
VKKSSIILVLIIAFILSFFSLFRQVNISENYRSNLSETEGIKSSYEKYIKLMLVDPISINESVYVDQISSISSFDLLIIVPSSICDACAISLLYHLKDSGIDLDNISLYVDKSYPQIVGIANNLGIGSISSLDVPEYFESILLVRHVKGFSSPYIMRYQDGFIPVLELFFQDPS